MQAIWSPRGCKGSENRGGTTEHRQVEALKATLTALPPTRRRLRPGTHLSRELDAAVAAPVTEVDPTLWLPDELMLAILLVAPFQSLWDGSCSAVCRRWKTLSESAPIRRRVRDERWAAFRDGIIAPRRVRVQRDMVWALAVGPTGKIYSATSNSDTGEKILSVWQRGSSSVSLRGHTDHVFKIAVTPGNTVYTASADCTVRSWSGDTDRLLCTHRGHSHEVLNVVTGCGELAVSRSADSTIRLWEAGAELSVIEGVEDLVDALAVGPNRRVFAGGYTGEIRRWDGNTGTELPPLVGHTDAVVALACDADRVFSGSVDTTVRAWCGHTGAAVGVWTGHTSTIDALVAGHGLVVSSSLDDRTVQVCSARHNRQCVLHTADFGDFPLAIGPRGELYCGLSSGYVVVL